MIAAVVLAAGSSSRMGEPKQLLRIGAQSLVRRIVEEAVASHVSKTIVVIGSEAGAVRAELSALPISLIENPRWSEGIGTSIAAGVEAANGCDAVVILACDQPDVSAATINSLVAEHHRTQKPIIASAYSDTLGIPALFAREYFAALRELPPEEGAKRVILAHPASVAAVAFAAGAVDLDTRADYARFLTS